MSKYRTDLDHCAFCAEYAHELDNGAIKFSLPVVKKFIETYTYFKYEDFTPSMIERLRLVMVDYYNTYVETSVITDGAAKKIDLPDFIFK